MLTSPAPRRPSQPSRGPLRRSGAANDNRRLRVIVPTQPRRLARHGMNLLKLNPYLRLAGEALNILDMLSNYQAEGWTNLGPWYSYAKCANISRPGPPMQIGRTTVHEASSYASLAKGCTQGQAAPNAMAPFTVLNSTRSIILGHGYEITGGLIRYQCVEAFTRPSTGPLHDPPPKYNEAKPAIALPAPVPSSWPLSAFPELAPPNQAPAFPAQRPYGRPDARSINSPAAYSPPSSGIAPVSKPSQVPNDWSVSIGTGPQSAPRTHTLAPPAGATPSGRIEKERKAKLSPAFAMALKAISMTTEAGDFINAIYDALPTEYRPRFRDTVYELRSATMQQKITAIIDHADKINIDEALVNLVTEQIEDRFYGTFGKMGGEVSRRLGIPYGAGLNSVGSRLRKMSYDSERAGENSLDGMGYN